jgi:hypothetical protein
MLDGLTHLQSSSCQPSILPADYGGIVPLKTYSRDEIRVSDETSVNIDQIYLILTRVRSTDLGLNKNPCPVTRTCAQTMFSGLGSWRTIDQDI